MNLNPAELLDPVFNFLDALIQNYGVYLYLGVCLAGAAGDRLDIHRRLAAETATGTLRRSRPRHHHYDATDEPTNTANYQHRG